MQLPLFVSPCLRTVSSSAHLNSLARAVVLAPKSAHASPLIRSFHWLKVKERIEYKIISLTFRTLLSSKPVYPRNLFTVQPPGSIRSSDCLTLLRPSCKSSLKITKRSFRIAAPELWNSLPPDLRPIVLVLPRLPSTRSSILSFPSQADSFTLNLNLTSSAILIRRSSYPTPD